MSLRCLALAALAVAGLGLSAAQSDTEPVPTEPTHTTITIVDLDTNTNTTLRQAGGASALVWTATSSGGRPTVVLRNPQRATRNTNTNTHAHRGFLRAGAGEAVPASTVGTGAYHWNWSWLNRLLANVTIVIPNQQFEKATFIFDLTNLVCKGFSIGNIQITVQESSIVGVSVTDVAAECKGDWHYEQSVIKIPFGSGQLDVQVSQSSIGGAITLEYNNTLHLPYTGDLTSCTTNFNLELSFSGGITADILNLFRSSISGAIRNSLNEQVCSLIKPLVVTNMTQALAVADAMAEPYMITPTPTPTPTLEGPLIDWRNSSLYASLRSSVAAYCNPTALNAFVQRMTHNTSVLSLPIHVTKELDTFLANFTATVHRVNFRNLSSFTALDVANATKGDGVLWRSEVGMDALGIAVDTLLVLDSNVAKGQHVANNISFGVDVERLGLVVEQAVAVAVNPYITHVLPLLLVNVFSPPCLTSAVQTLNLTSILPSFHSPPSFWITGYDPDFDTIFAQLLAMGYDLVHDAVPVLVTNVADGLLKTALNAALSTVFGGECVTPPRPSTPFVDFRESEHVRSMQAFLSTYASADAINALVRKLTAGTGSVEVPGTFLSTDVLSDDAGTLHVTLWDLHVANLDALTNLTVLAPPVDRPFTLSTNVSFATLERPLNVSVGIAVAYTERATNTTTTSSYVFSGGVGGVHLTADVLMELNATTLWTATVADLASDAVLNSLIGRFAVGNVTAAVADLHLTATNTSAPNTPLALDVHTGAGEFHLADLSLQDVTEAIASLLSLLSGDSSSSSPNPLLTLVAPSAEGQVVVEVVELQGEEEMGTEGEQGEDRPTRVGMDAVGGSTGHSSDSKHDQSNWRGVIVAGSVVVGVALIVGALLGFRDRSQ